MNCPVCGQPLPDDARFCPNCGAVVARHWGPRSARWSRSSSPTWWTPPASAQRLDPSGRVRCSAGSSTPPPKSSRAFAGGRRSSSATPSWPSSGCRTCTRTTRCGRSAPASRSAAASAASASEPGLADALEVRVGIESGEAATGVGPAGQLLVTGPVVNAAARLQTAAEPGEVLAGDHGAHPDRDPGRLRERRDIRRQGIRRAGSRPSPSTVSPPVRYAARSRSSVARASSRSCARCLRSGRHGTAPLATVVGEAGIGKITPRRRVRGRPRRRRAGAGGRGAVPRRHRHVRARRCGDPRPRAGSTTATAREVAGSGSGNSPSRLCARRGRPPRRPAGVSVRRCGASHDESALRSRRAGGVPRSHRRPGVDATAGPGRSRTCTS